MNLLMSGVTGYIGGHVAKRLLSAGHHITAIVRIEDAAETMRGQGMKAVVLDGASLDRHSPLLAEHDAVIWTAQLMLDDERRVASEIIAGLRGTQKTFMFTSGTSLLSQPTNGEWSEDSFSEYDDFVPRRQVSPRREIETMVRVAAQSDVRAIVLRPPLIWGNGGCRIVTDLYHSARATGTVCYVGRGLNLYTHVHVDDLAELYLLALERGVSGALYHAAAGEVNFRTMAEEIARHIGAPTRSVSIEEAAQIWDKFMGPIVFSGCSRSRAPRSRVELGWRPSLDRADLLEECRDPRYANADERAPPSWVRR